MKTPFRLHAATAFLTTSLLLSPSLLADDPAAGFVDFGKFTMPEGGGQFVEVNVKTQLLALAARLTEKSEPEIADLLRGLKSVRVNVLGVTDANRDELDERLRKIRRQLDAKGWERVVTIQEDKQDVAVYLKHRDDEAIEGLVVTVIDGDKEAVFVNVVGDIRPEKLAELGDRLNIAPLKKAAKAAKKS